MKRQRTKEQIEAAIDECKALENELDSLCVFYFREAEKLARNGDAQYANVKRILARRFEKLSDIETSKAHKLGLELAKVLTLPLPL